MLAMHRIRIQGYSYCTLKNVYIQMLFTVKRFQPSLEQRNFYGG